MVLSSEARGALEWVGADFEMLASSAPLGALGAPSKGTRWTNRELLFHMWFVQRIARVFIPMIGASRVSPARGETLRATPRRDEQPVGVGQLRRVKSQGLLDRRWSPKQVAQELRVRQAGPCLWNDLPT